jgi:hypothetical protein
MTSDHAPVSVTVPEYPTQARGIVLDRAYHASRAACETALSLGRAGSTDDPERGIVRPVVVDGDGPGVVCEASESGRHVGLVGPNVAMALRAADDERAWTGTGWLLDSTGSSSGRLRRAVVVEEYAGEWQLRVRTESNRSVVVALPAEVVVVLQRELRALGANEWTESAERTSEQSPPRSHDAV